ncbi:MAG: efflux transporter outer membrane subunit [Candidatus Schekmanbacteria bacterium]|nr:efflux transporter outer membrane subunit [Candidatus Schekmanbacteria bacterium]
MNKIIYILILCTISAACAPKVNYQPPQLVVPEKWDETQAKEIKPTSEEDVRWWRYFKDPQLDALIKQAAASNLDLRQADSRLREVRALRGAVEADLSPQVNAGTSYSRNRRSQNAAVIAGGRTGGGFSSRLDYNFYQAGFDASWEIDIYGQAKHLVEAAQADMEAVQEARRGIMISLLAEVSRNYIEFRGLQQQISIVGKNLKIQQDFFLLTKVRLEAGLGNDLDVSRAESQVSLTLAQIPTLEIAQKRAAHRLAILIGLDPGALWSELSPIKDLPITPDEVLVGLPADLMRRRPDLRQSERELAAAFAKSQASYADLYPQLTLTGNLGFQSTDISTLLQWPSKFWSFGPSLRFPLFNAGRIRSNIKTQVARQEQALIRYEQTLLTAMEEVENALTAYVREQKHRYHLEDARSANCRALDLAQELYLNGLSDFFPVLDAERSLYSVESQLAQSRSAVLSNLVAVYKSLGGGWEAME